MPLASSWKAGLPANRFAMPGAPFREAAGRGHLWFQVDGDQLLPDRFVGIRGIRSDDRSGIKRGGFEGALDRVAFIGVSQGAIAALYAVVSGRWNVGALIEYKAFSPVPVSSGSSGTPVLLVHGQNDRTIQPFASTLAASLLKTAGYKVDLKIKPGARDTISMMDARLGLDFLRKHLA